MKFFKYIMMFAAVIGLASCQPDSFRKVYPQETPELTASLQQQSVVYGSDSVQVSVAIKAKQTPLSTLSVKVMVGQTLITSEVIRTKDMEYNATLAYNIPFIAGLDEGAEVNVYLIAENVEGDQAQQIAGGCIGHRPAINTLFIMPPTIQYTLIGKGTEMQLENGKFVAYDLGFPKKFEMLLATKGTKFGRVDWTQPVFGMLDGELSIITEEQFNSGEAKSIVVEDDRYSSIDTLIFDPIAFKYTFGGKISTPIETLDVLADLEEAPAYIGSGSARKEYRGAKLFLGQGMEITVSGVNNLEMAYNLDYMEYVGGNKVKFLGETGMYYVSYKIAEDYLVVEPMYDLALPEVMYMCGVGMGQPSATPTVTTGWGFDSPNQNFVGRTIAPKVYQFTVYMKNENENADHPGFGDVNFKFFHQHGWGGEEAGINYQQVCCPGMTIISSEEEGNVGNWWSSAAPFEGIYRITLDMNAMTTTYEKVR